MSSACRLHHGTALSYELSSLARRYPHVRQLHRGETGLRRRRQLVRIPSVSQRPTRVEQQRAGRGSETVDRPQLYGLLGASLQAVLATCRDDSFETR